MATPMDDSGSLCQPDICRHIDVNVNDFRQYSESEKQWSARRQFIVKHIEEFGAKNRIDELLSLSMVWANHVFMGCRYGSELQRKVLEMAEGVDVGEMPSFQLLPGAGAKKRPMSSDGAEEPVKKCVPRPRFVPVQFVSSSISDEKENGEQVVQELCPQEAERDASSTGAAGLGIRTTGRGFMLQQDDSNTFEQLHGSGLLGQQEVRCQGLGFGQPDTLLKGEALSQPTLEEKQQLIGHVSAAVGMALRDPTCSSNMDTPNYNYILSRSIQACKTNPEYIYLHLRDMPAHHLPKNRKVPSDGYACELRCRGIYLATGYSASKNGARDQASEQAVKLLLKPVEVRVVQRKYKLGSCSDLVVCQIDAPTPSLAPAIRSPDNKFPPSTESLLESNQHTHWSQFVVMENAHDAICILNNSAAFNRMRIDYRFDQEPNGSMWCCSVYLQDELLAQAKGNKKMSKHTAAEEALRKLRANQDARQQVCQSTPPGPQLSSLSTRTKHLSELVILENSDNAICIINDTAQFNRVTADYKFVVLADHRYRCEVYLEGQFVAAAVGPKKTVKHLAAEEALARLRQSHAVVKSNLRLDDDEEAISRSQILDHKGHVSQIREDNIGNQLLRKMGWTGGGLGREGEGIAEPISVKEQFTREGLGLDMDRPSHQLNSRDIEEIICDYASSNRQDDLRFSSELNSEERKQIHQISQKYGLRSKSYGHGPNRFLIVSRKVQKEQLIGQLLQEGQVGRYELVQPQTY